jgi:hypothetical protein
LQLSTFFTMAKRAKDMGTNVVAARILTTTLLQELILLNTQPAEGTLPARGLDHRIFLKIDQGRQFPLFSQIFFTVGCPFT